MSSIIQNFVFQVFLTFVNTRIILLVSPLTISEVITFDLPFRYVLFVTGLGHIVSPSDILVDLDLLFLLLRIKCGKRFVIHILLVLLRECNTQYTFGSEGLSTEVV